MNFYQGLKGIIGTPAMSSALGRASADVRLVILRKNIILGPFVANLISRDRGLTPDPKLLGLRPLHLSRGSGACWRIVYFCYCCYYCCCYF